MAQKMLPKSDVIRIVGAKEHNLKGLNVDIPRNCLAYEESDSMYLLCPSA